MAQLPQKTFLRSVAIPTTYLFVMLGIVVALFQLDTPLIQYLQSTGVQTTPGGSSTVGQLSFVAVFLTISIVSVFGLAWLLHKKKIKDKIFWFLALFFLISESILSISVIYWAPPVAVIGFMIIIWTAYMLSATGKINRMFVLPFMTCYAILAAMALVISIPPLTLLILPIAFSCWDLYAVFRGPMTKVATGILELPKLRHLFVVRIGQVTLGMGDLLFYCLTAGTALLFGAKVGSMAIGFMTGGIFLTLMLLKSGRFRALPGLPIPIASAMVGFALAVFAGIGP